MVFRYFFLVYFTIGIVQINSQNTLSGFLIPEKGMEIQAIKLIGITGNESQVEVSREMINEDGYFVFAQEDTAYDYYQLQIVTDQVSPGKIGNIQLPCLTPIFLIQNDLDYNFDQDTCVSSDLSGNALAYTEWQKFRNFQKRSVSNLSAQQTRDYLNDSLELLLVKLFGTKTLDQKNLLQQDISENPAYYTEFLEELHSSAIHPAYYYFLEGKMAMVENEILSAQVSWSTRLNYALGGLLLFCLIGIARKYHTERKENLLHTLSIQESRIKNLIIAGKTNKEIGNELFISVSTVKTHISNIYQKLGVNSRKELINLK